MKDARLDVRGIKTFRGRDGEGLSANLYFDGRKVCEVLDEGHGGEPYYRWTSTKAERDVIEYVGSRKPVLVFTNLWTDMLATSPAEAVPEVYCPRCGGTIHRVTESDRMVGWMVCRACKGSVKYAGDSLDSFIDMYVDDWQAEKMLRRSCRTKTIFRRKADPVESYRTLHVAFSPKVKDELMKKFPDVVEIVNERFA